MNEPLDPNDFVITRKRKKYRFAKFANAKNCVEFDDWKQQAVDIIELGAGTGLLAVELARRHPSQRVVAVDVKGDRLQKGAYQALETGVDNVQFVRARADQLAALVPPASLAELWITFADPFPKKSAAARRMTHENFLASYQKILKPGGKLIIKHDNPDFFAWTLEQLVRAGWHIDELVFDLHDSDLSDDYKILTSYEQRWIAEGNTINFVRAEP